jgi:hypothetical protein
MWIIMDTTCDERYGSCHFHDNYFDNDDANSYFYRWYRDIAIFKDFEGYGNNLGIHFLNVNIKRKANIKKNEKQNQNRLNVNPDYIPRDRDFYEPPKYKYEDIVSYSKYLYDVYENYKYYDYMKMNSFGAIADKIKSVAPESLYILNYGGDNTNWCQLDNLPYSHIHDAYNIYTYYKSYAYNYQDTIDDFNQNYASIIFDSALNLYRSSEVDINSFLDENESNIEDEQNNNIGISTLNKNHRKKLYNLVLSKLKEMKLNNNNGNVQNNWNCYVNFVYSDIENSEFNEETPRDESGVLRLNVNSNLINLEKLLSYIKSMSSYNLNQESEINYYLNNINLINVHRFNKRT